jgi:putative nucleotidyltransferase with HDIG domain
LGCLDELERLLGLKLRLLEPAGPSGAEYLEPGSLRLPLGEPEGPVGYLAVSPPPRAHLEGLLRHLAALLGHLGRGEGEMDQIARELSCRYEEINLLFRVGEHLKGLEGSERALRDILEESVTALECDLILLSLPASGLLRQAGAVRLDTSRLSRVALVEQLEAALQGREFLVTLGAEESRLWGAVGLAATSSIAFPVKVEGKRAGVLACLSTGARPLTNSNVNLMRALAAQISIVLTNNQLLQTMRDFLLEVVTTLVSVIEAKDEYTRGHSERVQAMSLAVGEAMGLEPGLKEDLRWAAILHDIGKLGIPDTILRKPGKLTAEEFAEIKKHPDRGVEILKHLALLAHVLPAIRHHHERVDGRGYPGGLSGEAIPLLARIIAVGDTFDAITSTRAYRVAGSPAEALAEIERVAGTQLDAQIASIFVTMCRQDLGAAILAPLSQLGREGAPLGEVRP